MSVTKMFFLSHILYFFRTLPSPLLSSQLNKLQAIINNFIWKNSWPRINHSLLCTPTKYAGLEVLNMLIYYKAVILAQTKHWWNPHNPTTWLRIEYTAMVTAPKQLLSALLLQHQPSIFFLDTASVTIRVWNALLQREYPPNCSIISQFQHCICSFQTPLLNNRMNKNLIL